MSREAQSIKNAKVGLVFYAITIFVAFYSRKVFLDYLGADFIGLTSVLKNILGFLNLAELGVSTAIGYALYKPIYNQDQEEINKLVQYFGFVYRKIGLIILSLSILVSLFFPLFFSDIPFSLTLVYYAFFTFVISSLIGYFFNYHQTLFVADQKEYIIKQYLQSLGILKSLIQISLIYIYTDYYLWITIELLYAVLTAIVLRWRVKVTYSWLNISLLKKYKSNKYPVVFKKIKQIFVHKMAFFVLMGTDQILIYAFVNLESVAFFSNYQLIFGHIKAFVNSGFNGTQASIGNLIAENDTDNMRKVFWEMMAIRHFFAGFLFMSMYFLTDPFIEVWLGEKYLLEYGVLILMCANIYISQSRAPISNFINGFGLFSDTWAPITEAILNLGVSIAFGMHYGIFGIMLGTFISTLIIVVIWKPYFLYKNGFKMSVKYYWIGFSKLFISFLAAFALINFLINKFFDFKIYNYYNWFLFAISVVTVVLIVFSSLLYAFNRGFRNFTKRIKTIIKKKLFKR